MVCVVPFRSNVPPRIVRGFDVAPRALAPESLRGACVGGRRSNSRAIDAGGIGIRARKKHRSGHSCRQGQRCLMSRAVGNWTRDAYFRSSLLWTRLADVPPGCPQGKRVPAAVYRDRVGVGFR